MELECTHCLKNNLFFPWVTPFLQHLSVPFLMAALVYICCSLFYLTSLTFEDLLLWTFMMFPIFHHYQKSPKYFRKGPNASFSSEYFKYFGLQKNVEFSRKIWFLHKLRSTQQGAFSSIVTLSPCSRATRSVFAGCYEQMWRGFRSYWFSCLLLDGIYLGVFFGLWAHIRGAGACSKATQMSY